MSKQFSLIILFYLRIFSPRLHSFIHSLYPPKCNYLKHKLSCVNVKQLTNKFIICLFMPEN